MQYTPLNATNSEIDSYKEMLKHFFISHFSNTEKHFENNNTKGEYLAVINEMRFVRQTDTWKQFSQSLLDKGLINRHRVFTQPTSHSLKIMCGLNTPPSMRGIAICLSFLGNFYGFYYINDVNSNDVPFFGKEFDTYLSYFPLDADQSKTTEKIKILIKEYFPDFSEFNSKFASYPISDIQIGHRYIEAKDLFKVLFDNDPGGIFF